MKASFKYALLLLAMFFAAVNSYSQVEEKHRKLMELKQMEKGYADVKEIDPLIVQAVPSVQDIIFVGYSGSTKINLRKKLDGISMTHNYNFNVDENYSGIEFYIRGEINQGSFKIKIIKPDKTTLREFTISPGNSQDWGESYLLDKEKKTGIGQWKVQLTANKAEGYFQFISSSR